MVCITLFLVTRGQMLDHGQGWLEVVSSVLETVFIKEVREKNQWASKEKQTLYTACMLSH